MFHRLIISNYGCDLGHLVSSQEAAGYYYFVNDSIKDTCLYRGSAFDILRVFSPSIIFPDIIHLVGCSRFVGVVINPFVVVTGFFLKISNFINSRFKFVIHQCSPNLRFVNEVKLSLNQKYVKRFNPYTKRLE